MADPNGFAWNTGELKATARYFDQIQRASDRLGRARYQNMIKLNNELKFTVRYFDQVYRTALKLSRLKLMPRVTLDDKASKDIDRLIAKLGQVRSKRIQVTAEMKMNTKRPAAPASPKVQQRTETLPPIAQGAPVLPKVPQRVETLPPIATGAAKVGKARRTAPKPASAAEKPSMTQQQQQSLTLSITNPAASVPPIDLQPVVTALVINTDAVVQLTSQLGNLQFGAAPAPAAKEKKPNLWSVMTTVAGGAKSFAEGRTNIQAVRTKRAEIEKLDQEWSARSTPSGGSADEAVYRNQKKLLQREITSNKFSAVTNFMDTGEKGYTGVKDIVSMFQGPEEEKPSVTEAASMLVQQTSESGLLDNLAKGVVGRVLGPVSSVLQVGDAIRSTDDRARFETLGGAAGGAIGGSAGAAIGTAILPGIGTAVGGYLGGMAGDFVGEKVGGLVYEYGGKATEFIDSTLDNLSDKMNKFFSWGKDKDKVEEKKPVEPKPAPPLSPTLARAAGIEPPAMYGPMRDPAAPRAADPFDAIGMMNQRIIDQAAPKPTVPVSPAAQPEGGQIHVEMSQTQMGTLSGMIQDAKTEVTNQVSINISPGTVQLDIHEEIDYAEIEGKIGAAIVAKVRQAFNNYKPSGGGSGGPSQAMAT